MSTLISTTVARARLNADRLTQVANSIGLVVSLIALCILFTVLSDFFFAWDNALNIGRASAYTGVAAAITTLVLVGGALDLSIAAVMALTSVVAARLLAEGLPLWLTIVCCLGVGAAVGIVNGGIVTYIGINPLIVTIGTQFIVRGIAYALTVVEGGELLITDRNFLYIGQESVLGLPVSVWLLLATLLIVGWVMSRTTFGRHVYALGGNPQAARLAGVPVNRRKMAIYILSGTGAAFSGIVLGSYTGAGIAYAAMGAELTVIGAVILGGTSLLGGYGSVFGTFLGIAILGVINNGIVLLGLGNHWQLIVTGSILLLAVAIDEIRAARKTR